MIRQAKEIRMFTDETYLIKKLLTAAKLLEIQNDLQVNFTFKIKAEMESSQKTVFI